LQVFSLPNLDTPVYVTDLRNLPTTLTANGQAKRVGMDQAAPAEILLCALGDEIDSSTYMIVSCVTWDNVKQSANRFWQIRAEDDELALYEPYRYPATAKFQPFTTDLRWRKVAAFQPESPASWPVDGGAETNFQPLRRIELDGRSAALMHRGTSLLILKEAGSVARAYQVDDKSMHVLNSIRLDNGQSGMMSVNADVRDSIDTSCRPILTSIQGNMIISQLPESTNYGTTGWGISQLSVDEGIEHMCYHSESSSYVIATSMKGSFALPDDEWHPEWSEESTVYKSRAKNKLTVMQKPHSDHK
jgi:hypothetical protein